MAEVTTVTGMILSAMPVGEYDRRLVILTKELGKITVFAKGARKPNSALIGVTRSFIFGTFDVYRGRDSYTMYKASAKEYFENVVNDLNAVCYACYFAEIADYYGRENLDASEMINVLYITLKALGKKLISYELIRDIYEIRMIAVNGECPDFFTCSQCGEEKDLSEYSFSRNGMFCRNCAGEVHDGVRLSGSAVYTLQYIVTSQLTKLYSFTVTVEVERELGMIVNRLEKHVFDKEFKSREMLNLTI